MRKARAGTGRSSSSSHGAGLPRHLVWGRPELESSSSGEDLFSPYEGKDRRTALPEERVQEHRQEASGSQQLLHDCDASIPSTSTSLTGSSDTKKSCKDGFSMPASVAKVDVKDFYSKLKEVAKHTSPSSRTAWDADAKKVAELATLDFEEAEEEEPEEDEPDGEWSVGSEKHSAGQCRPCHYVFSKSGCANGTACTFCHLPHPKRFRPRPSKSKQHKCKRLAAVLDKVQADDPDGFQILVEQLGAQGGYLNTVVKSRMRSRQQKTQVPDQPREAPRVLKPGLVSL
ncbi:unnamed protein product [Symbiodinium natans]|uniref:C3H1-type domain-containing protein n=1 Tax=Symbiodinium natans TaxID=878477 RepID=A0A812PCC3_9DINO|nr:unnamed protein product [Symbiodinium natans]